MGLKFGLLHWLCLWALTQCNATALPVMWYRRAATSKDKPKAPTKRLWNFWPLGLFSYLLCSFYAFRVMIKGRSTGSIPGILIAKPVSCRCGLGVHWEGYSNGRTLADLSLSDDSADWAYVSHGIVFCVAFIDRVFNLVSLSRCGKHRLWLRPYSASRLTGSWITWIQSGH